LNLQIEAPPETKPELIEEPTIKDVYTLLTTSVEEQRTIKKMILQLHDTVHDHADRLVEVEREMVILKTHEKRLKSLETIFLAKYAAELTGE
jgi:hypothetical protein